MQCSRVYTAVCRTRHMHAVHGRTVLAYGAGRSPSMAPCVRLPAPRCLLAAALLYLTVNAMLGQESAQAFQKAACCSVDGPPEETFDTQEVRRGSLLLSRAQPRALAGENVRHCATKVRMRRRPRVPEQALTRSASGTRACTVRGAASSIGIGTKPGLLVSRARVRRTVSKTRAVRKSADLLLHGRPPREGLRQICSACGWSCVGVIRNLGQQPLGCRWLALGMMPG